MDRPVVLEGMANPALRVESGKIVIDSLDVMADMGFHDFEVGNPQRLLVSVELWLDEYDKPPENDDPARAWDYDFIVKENPTARDGAAVQSAGNAGPCPVRAARRGAGVAGDFVSKTVKPDVYPDAAGVGVEIASFKGTAP